MEPVEVVERVAVESYSRLLAYVAVRTRDIQAAEDALSEAFRAALETWPAEGVPAKPEGWLLTVARRRLVDEMRRESVREAALPDVFHTLESGSRAAELGPFPDERVQLLYTCAHPAIDKAVRTPLVLQTVLGLDAATIASAMLLPPATLSQRLVRAKAKIKATGVRFAVPAGTELRARTATVLDAIYAAYGTDWSGGHRRFVGLAGEARYLASMVAKVAPGDAEALGLLALILFNDSRSTARIGSDGRLVPLEQQDPAAWDRDLIDEASRLMAKADALGSPGRYQLEAAIQSTHARRVVTGTTDWPALLADYNRLIEIAPTIGALVSRAAVVHRAIDAVGALAALDELPQDRVQNYQPYWAVRAHILGAVGDSSGAIAAYRRAIGLAEDDATRLFLIERMQSEQGAG